MNDNEPLGNEWHLDDGAAPGVESPGTGPDSGDELPPALEWEEPAPVEEPVVFVQPQSHKRRHAWTVAISAAAAVVVAVAGFGVSRAFLSDRTGVAAQSAVSIPVPGTTPAPLHLNPNGTLDTAAIVSAADPGIVDINTKLGYQAGQAAGTGVVLTSSGEVLTNNHVIAGATSISVTDVGNGQTYKATVVGYSVTNDIAVLQLQGASGLKTVSLGNSASLKVGAAVVAIGNALGQGGTPSVSTGDVTALNQSITASDPSGASSEKLTGLIQISAPLQPGDSGGPLVDARGQVVGIDTATSASGRYRQQITGSQTAYAIPINEAVSIAREIVAGQSSATVHIGLPGFLGVQLDPTIAINGAAVVGVEPGSPVANAGIVAGDVITSFDGHTVGSASALSSLASTHHPGDHVQIGWTDQQGQSHTATLTLAAGPAL